MISMLPLPDVPFPNFWLAVGRKGDHLLFELWIMKTTPPHGSQKYYTMLCLFSWVFNATGTEVPLPMLAQPLDWGVRGGGCCLRKSRCRGKSSSSARSISTCLITCRETDRGGREKEGEGKREREERKVTIQPQENK